MVVILNKTSTRVSVTLALLIASFVASQLVVCVSARYLPTRSQDDRLERLRELLKDLLEGDLERRPVAAGIDYGDLMNPNRAAIYKRSTISYADKMGRSVEGMPQFRVEHSDFQKSLD